MKESANTTSKGASSRLKKALLQSVEQKRYREVGRYLWRPGDCQRDRLRNQGDSILNVVCCEVLRV